MSGDIKRAEIVHDLDLFTALIMRAGVEWIVIHTNPRCEKRALEGLQAAGILGYLPMEYEVRQRMRKGKPTGGSYTVKRPLFTRYLFAGIDRNKGQEVADVRACDGVEGVLSFAESGAPVRVSAKSLVEIVHVAHGTYEGEPLPEGFMAEIAKLETGCVVKLVKGCWEGLDFTFTGYHRVKQQLKGEITGAAGTMRVSVPLDAVALPTVSQST